MTIKCKFCGSKEYVKSGVISGSQRYRCKKCRRYYTEPQMHKKTRSDILEKNDFSDSKVEKVGSFKETVLNIFKKFFCY